MFEPAGLISRAIVLLVAVVVHEWAHVYAAYTQGDYTGYEQGKMTLDPRANVYWPGYLIGVLIGFAPLGFAPVNPYRMRDPRWGRMIAVAAGPLSNLVVAAIFGAALRLTPLNLDFWSSVGGVLPTPERLLTDMVWLNAMLFFFNLIPLFPLDGWTVMLTLLPREMAIWWERHQRESLYVFYGLIALTFLAGYLNVSEFSPLHWLVGVPSTSLTFLLAGQ